MSQSVKYLVVHHIRIGNYPELFFECANAQGQHFDFIEWRPCCASSYRTTADTNAANYKRTRSATCVCAHICAICTCSDDAGNDQKANKLTAKLHKFKASNADYRRHNDRFWSRYGPFLFLTPQTSHDSRFSLRSHAKHHILNRRHGAFNGILRVIEVIGNATTSRKRSPCDIGRT